MVFGWGTGIDPPGREEFHCRTWDPGNHSCSPHIDLAERLLREEENSTSKTLQINEYALSICLCIQRFTF